MELNPYLLFNGNCEAAFQLYQRVLAGEIIGMFRFDGMPAECPTPAGWGDKIMHVSMKVGDRVLMGSDAPPGRYEKPAGFSVSINVADVAEAERVFQALSENGTVSMPLEETFWAKRFAMFTDQFGIPWQVNCEKPMPANG